MSPKERLGANNKKKRPCVSETRPVRLNKKRELYVFYKNRQEKILLVKSQTIYKTLHLFKNFLQKKARIQ